MEKKERIAIERVGNGYIVRPDGERGLLLPCDQVLVFNDMGYASAARDNQTAEQTLLGFIAKHFEG